MRSVKLTASAAQNLAGLPGFQSHGFDKVGLPRLAVTQVGKARSETLPLGVILMVKLQLQGNL